MLAKLLMVALVGIVSARSAPLERPIQAAGYGPSAPPPASTCASIKDRVDCGNANTTQATCTARQCCWDGGAHTERRCFYPSEGVPVKRVFLIQSNHFDAGFTNYTKFVVDEYIHQYNARAINVSVHARPGENYRWLTQSYLVSLALDCPPGMRFTCPNASEVADLRAALKNGTIYYHAFPTNGQNEIADAFQLEFGVNMTHELDDALGLPRKVTFSQRDVPGLIRASLPALARQGVKAISEGSNAANIPPDVPPAFWWRDEASDTTMFTMFHPYGYGTIDETNLVPPEGRLSYPSKQEGWTRDYVRIPGFDAIMVYNWRVDNHGPALNATEVSESYATIRKAFPDAQIVTTSLDDYVNEALAFLEGHRDVLPVVTAEIGDSWLYGIGSDPVKLMQFRSASRFRAACVADGSCSPHDYAFRNFSRLLQKASEHTFGQAGSVMAHKWQNLTNNEFHKLVAERADNLAALQYSWDEQRNYSIDYAIEALPEASSLRRAIESDFAAMRELSEPPSLDGMTRVPSPTQALRGLGGWLTMAFDATTSALTQLVDERTGERWASPSTPVGLFEYVTPDENDLKNFQNGYCSANGCFNYPMPNANHMNVRPGIQAVYLRNGSSDEPSAASPSAAAASSRVIVHGAFNASTNGSVAISSYGCPTDVWITYDISATAVDVTLAIINKQATRQPESLFFSFNFAGDTANGRPSSAQLLPDLEPVRSFEDAKQIKRDFDAGAAAPPAPGARRPRSLHAGHADGEDPIVDAALHLASHHKDGNPHRTLDDIVTGMYAECAGFLDRLRREGEDAHWQLISHLRGEADAPWELSHLDEDCAVLARVVRPRPIAVENFARHEGWEILKLGEWLDPADYVGHAARSLTGVGDGARFTPKGGSSTVTLNTTDAGIIRWGAPLPWPTPMTGTPDFAYGAGFMLYTNVYPVNFPLWLPWWSAQEAHPNGLTANYAWRFSFSFGPSAAASA